VTGMMPSRDNAPPLELVYGRIIGLAAAGGPIFAILHCPNGHGVQSRHKIERELRAIPATSARCGRD